ncbi:MAG: hypothetical protein ACRD04_04425 [Terriglobales bacterium]
MQRWQGWLAIAALLLAAAAGARADTILRYTMIWKIALPTPAAATRQLPRSQVIEVHGQQALMRQGGMHVLENLATGQITLLYPAQQEYALTTAAELAQQVKTLRPQAPNLSAQQQQALAAMQISVDTQPAQPGTAILGVATRQNGVTIRLKMDLAKLAGRPLPAGTAAELDFMRIVEQVWTPSPAALQSNPALRQMATAGRQVQNMFSPMTGLQHMFPAAIGSKLAPMIQAMEHTTQQGPALRVHMQIFMPMVAAMLKAAQRAHPGQPMPSLDPNAPLMEMDMVATELAKRPLPAGDFRVPAGYRKVTASQILKALQPASPGQRQP